MAESKTKTITLEVPVRDLPRIDFKNGALVTPNNEYFIEVSDLTPKRYMKYEELAVLAGYGCTIDEIFERFSKIYTINTTGNSVLEAANKSANWAMDGMNAIKKRKEEDASKFLWFATIFLNTKDEDIKTYNMEVAKRKVRDWSESGVPMRDFFFLFASVVKEYTEILDQLDGDMETILKNLEAGLSKLKSQEIKKGTEKSPKQGSGSK